MTEEGEWRFMMSLLCPNFASFMEIMAVFSENTKQDVNELFVLY